MTAYRTVARRPPPQRRRREMLATPLENDPPVARSPELIWSAPAESMALFVERTSHRHGSLSAWPAAAGVPADTADELRHRLLVDLPG